MQRKVEIGKYRANYRKGFCIVAGGKKPRMRTQRMTELLRSFLEIRNFGKYLIFLSRIIESEPFVERSGSDMRAAMVNILASNV